jgi:hypothetical protein
MRRVVLIRYREPDESARWVGSGLLVTDRAVLTADHVAHGSRHTYTVICDDGEFLVDEIVRSGLAEADLAVLLLSQEVPGLRPLSFARVDRSQVAKVGECVAVGYPRWRTRAGQRLSAQVSGYVPTGEGRPPLAAEGAGRLLTLVGDRMPGAPEVPPGALNGSPWGGMSGAVVTAHDVIIGVIHSHNVATGAQSLSVTPLEALNMLPSRQRRRFCEALGIDGEIDDLPALPRPGNGFSLRVGGSRPLVFDGEVKDRYASVLAHAGLELPDQWSHAEMDRLRRGYAQGLAEPDSTADLLEALCTALTALPVMLQVGGHEISVGKLQDLYHWHVGRWPDFGSREGMLVLAASAAIAERRAWAAGHQREPLSALARFMLGIAGQRAARGGAATLASPHLHGLAEWLAEVPGLQYDDAADYLERKVGGRTWALIELKVDLKALDADERAWPDRVVVDLVPEHGPGRTLNVRCRAASRDGLLSALRDAVRKLPDGEVCVDLVLPRRWLDEGVEHWDAVQAGDQYESISQHLEPRLRWAMHRHDRWLRDRLRKRFARIDWSASPEAIPRASTDDPGQFSAWLGWRDHDRATHPPYLVGSSSPGARGHDPLGALLRYGYGLIVWFNGDAADQARLDAVRLAEGLPRLACRHELPRTLAERLKPHRPLIIWSDPDGRGGFPLPAPRRAGTLRGGAN